jgi:hypothetical protein
MNARNIKRIDHYISWTIALVIVSVSVLECGEAWADWSIAGAQYACNNHSHSFEIRPTIAYSSSSDPPTDAPLTGAFKKVHSDRPIACSFGKDTLRTTIRIIEPSDGNGMGGGRADITSMRLGALRLFSRTEYLGWGSERAEDRLVRVRVSSEKGSVSVERCYGEVDLQNQPKIDHCETKSLRTSP